MLHLFKALFETKRSASAPLIALHQAGRPQWTPRDYAGLASAGYMENPVGYRCARMIAESAASVPWLLYEGSHEISEHSALDLLRHPHPGQSGRTLMEAFYAGLQIAGNAYMEAVPLEGAIRELHVLRSDRMQAIASVEGWTLAYDYSVNGQSVNIPASLVLHEKLYHPLNDHYGLSPLEAAGRAIDTHSSASGWAKSILDNAARPSGALIYSSANGSLTAEQHDRLKSELENSYQGARNAGRPLVLEGGLDWKVMSHSPRDLEFIEIKNAAAREVALAFGVPPMLLGIPGDNTFANYAEANRTFWQQTVLPLVGRVAESLTNWLLPNFGPGLRLGYDVDAIAALGSEREALWQRVGQATFLSDDEKRLAVGYGPAAPSSGAE